MTQGQPCHLFCCKALCGGMRHFVMVLVRLRIFTRHQLLNSQPLVPTCGSLFKILCFQSQLLEKLSPEALDYLLKIVTSPVLFLPISFSGLVLDLIVIAILKVSFRRSRPAHNEEDMFATVSVDNYSFPSGHASRAGMLFCFFILQVATSIKWITLVTVWSIVVSLSRVILGRHHIIDVICGYFVGILEYLLLLYLWIPTETCMNWLDLYFSHFHL